MGKLDGKVESHNKLCQYCYCIDKLLTHSQLSNIFIKCSISNLSQSLKTNFLTCCQSIRSLRLEAGDALT